MDKDEQRLFNERGKRLDEYRTRICELEAELAEAREDSERLEEIKAAAAHLLANDGGKYSEGFSYADAKIARERLRGLLSDTELSAATTPFRRYESNHAAIDAARKGGER